MQSFTLQTGDTIITSGDQLGQLQFAASAESDGSASRLVAARVYAQAEGSFTSASNPTSLVLATAEADASEASPKIKITDSGHILPINDGTNDLGNSNLQFRRQFISEGVVLASNTPASTTNKLYNEGGTLKFNGSAVGGGGSYTAGSGITIDASDNIHVFDGSGYLWDLEVRDKIANSGCYKGFLNEETDGATVTFNMDESNLHEVTLGGNRTLAVSNVDKGQRFIISLIQDGTGSRTVTWFGGISWPGGLVPSLTATANKTDVFSFICTDTGAYDGFVVGYNL